MKAGSKQIALQGQRVFVTFFGKKVKELFFTIALTNPDSQIRKQFAIRTILFFNKIP
jgi:hypothetical protein